eukprot:CAMPEP_0201568054 /NCGR_PEP_ID=MMETSP0190_2-20130828/8903_1 /ASSEMBLY_ACC=CAM_ASM_000263 /TAXON_ID=37353 /ORGANISM="Rosalina sp." /LENGTH=93 /DNA_ID=CAMNT_0047988747 /DNA_START=6 /DNA_END=283 /DNA_ORIENTATION=+
MGNELKSQSNFDIQTEQHTIDEEAPLNKLNLNINDNNTSNKSDASSQQQQESPSDNNTSSLPPGWEQRTDADTNKPYYINHNNQTTQWNPPNT